MINVYGGSMLNIAASRASDDGQGWFFKRRDMRRCHISIKLDTPLEHSRRCPLETRGWTLQERLLSPRTVREEVF